MQVETFSTAGVPARERPGAWQQAVGRLARVDFGTTPIGDAPFNASMKVYSGRRLRFCDYTFSPHVTTSLASSRSGHFILSYLKEGHAIFEQEGREAVLKAGDVVLFDPMRPLRIEAEMKVRSFDIGSERMKEIMPQIDGLTSIALKGDSISSMPLRRLLDQLADNAERFSDEVGDRIADAIPHLIAASLVDIPEASSGMPGQMEAYHRARIREFVRSHLGDPDLDPEMVAEGVDLSPRHVHQLFSDGEMTLMRWVWSQRLKNCREELTNPALRHWSVGEIAFRWGFSSQAHFSRMFRTDTGCSPREFRQRSLLR
jgi:AraC-like DNA-binding protein